MSLKLALLLISLIPSLYFLASRNFDEELFRNLSLFLHRKTPSTSSFTAFS
jgi:hypothetical protein